MCKCFKGIIKKATTKPKTKTVVKEIVHEIIKEVPVVQEVPVIKETSKKQITLMEFQALSKKQRKALSGEDIKHLLNPKLQVYDLSKITAIQAVGLSKMISKKTGANTIQRMINAYATDNIK